MPKSLISELSDTQLDELLAYVPEFSENNLENIKRLTHQKTRRKFSMKKLATTIAAAALFIATSTGIFAASGGLDDFLARFNPNFGEFAIAPLEPAYATDQGIRIEVVGAQQIDNVVLIYTIMQDTTGENRLTRHMSPDIELYVEGERMSSGAGTGRRLRFDRTTNTIYTERILLGHDHMPKTDTIELLITRIDCFEHSGPVRRAFEGQWHITVNASDLGIQPILKNNITVGNLNIEHLSLSPFGLQFRGTHKYGGIENFPNITTELELNNRRNYTFSSRGGGLCDDSFSFFSFATEPIDLQSVTAIIINNHRIPLPN